MSTTTNSEISISSIEELRYPPDLRRLPELLERLERLQYELDGISAQAFDVASESEALSSAITDVARFVEVRVAVNRARERRRVRRRHGSNGYVPVELNGRSR